MRIDRTQSPWVIATVALAIVSTVAYVVYAVDTRSGPRGGSAIGHIARVPFQSGSRLSNQTLLELSIAAAL